MRRFFKPMASPFGPVILAACIAAALTAPAADTRPDAAPGTGVQFNAGGAKA